MVLLEQPVGWNELDSLVAIRQAIGIPIAADECLHPLDDTHKVIAQGAADSIDMKIMKAGVLEEAELVSLPGSHGGNGWAAACSNHASP